MEEVLGVTRRLYKPSPAQPSLAQSSPAQPSPEQPSPKQSSPEVPEDRDTVRVPRRDLMRAAKLLQDLSAGKKVKLLVIASREEVPFTVPDVLVGETDCVLCHQAFKSAWSAEAYEDPYWGDGVFLSVWEGPGLENHVGSTSKILQPGEKSLVQGL